MGSYALYLSTLIGGKKSKSGEITDMQTFYFLYNSQARISTETLELILPFFSIRNVLETEEIVDSSHCLLGNHVFKVNS